MRLDCRFLDQWDMMPDELRARFDSLSVFTQNQLQQVIPETYDKLYAEYDAKDHVPVKSNLNYALPAWAYDSYDKRGQADFLGANATDIPRVDVSKQRFTFPIRTIITGYGWSIEEIEAARAAGEPLDRMKADTAREAIAWKEHDLILQGDAKHNIPGFLTNAAVSLMAAITGAWVTGSGATADQMVDDMQALVDKVFVSSNRRHRANAITLPVAHYRRFATKRIDDVGQSAMQYFLSQNPEIKSIGTMLELSTGDAAGTGPRAVAYQKDPRNVSAIVPMTFQQMEPQPRGMEVLIPCRAREGGAVWFYPAAGCFMDGL